MSGTCHSYGDSRHDDLILSLLQEIKLALYIWRDAGRKVMILSRMLKWVMQYEQETYFAERPTASFISFRAATTKFTEMLIFLYRALSADFIELE